jgi:hypothetical protein
MLKSNGHDRQEPQLSMQYGLVQADVIPSLKTCFYEFLKQRDVIDTAMVEPSLLRRHLFDYFETKEFIEKYQALALTIAQVVFPKEIEFIVQKTPTPRIFRPGAHGTSFHCDYWYGHGEHSYTIWTPLSGIDENNTFLMCDEKYNDEVREKITNSKQFIDVEANDRRYFRPVAPGSNEACVFGSKMMHGSPINMSKTERISFDFRIGLLNDATSTKNINTYLHYRNNQFVVSKPFTEMKFIRYVCGGKNKDTLAQHLVIDSAARNFNLTIVGQEAEAERLGYPVLQEILNTKNLNKEFNAIIIASESVISLDLINQIRNSNLKIFTVLENRFLN